MPDGFGRVDIEAARAFWERAIASGAVPPGTELPGEIGPFGDSRELAGELIELVVSGIKTATASTLVDYSLDDEPLPAAGELWIATSGAGIARALLRTTEVRVGAFGSVDDAFAWDEGEGDRTRRYWLDAHTRFFERYLPTLGIEFDPDMPTVFERFELLYAE